MFWYLDRPCTMRGRALWDEDIDYSFETCPVNPDHPKAAGRAMDLQVLLTSTRFADLIWTVYVELMVQERTLEAFREQGFTGFDVKPVSAGMRIRTGPDPFYRTPFANEMMGVYKSKAAGVEIPKLWEIVVTGWGGIADPRSGVEFLSYCPGCKKSWYAHVKDTRYLIDESQWDGSDFFVVWPYPQFIFVSDRVAKFLRKAKCKGYRLLRPESVEICRTGPPETSAGRLSYWFPDARAREIGEPLGIY